MNEVNRRKKEGLRRGAVEPNRDIFPHFRHITWSSCVHCNIFPGELDLSNHGCMSQSPSKRISGLPPASDHAYRDVHMDTAKNFTYGSQDIRMDTAKGLSYGTDIRMNTVHGGTTLRQNNFQPWERELLGSAELRRKSTVAQLCALVYLLSIDVRFSSP